MLAKKNNDLGVIFVPAQDITDFRFPTAEELSLAHYLQAIAPRNNSGGGWQEAPQLKIEHLSNNNQLTVAGSLVSKYWQTPQEIDFSIVIPNLSDLENTQSKQQYLYIINFVAEVGEEQDSDLGNFSVQYVAPDGIKSFPSKENTRRFRVFQLLVLTADGVLDSNWQDGFNTTTIQNKSSLGFEVNSLRFWALDPELLQQATYSIFPEATEIYPVCKLDRKFKILKDGYYWGITDGTIFSERPLNTDTNLCSLYLDKSLRRSISALIAGFPMSGSCQSLAIKNLIAGGFTQKPYAPGETSGSPNNSQCIANDQRVSFSNEARICRYSVQHLQTNDYGNGQARAIATINTNAPAGTVFSDNVEDHRIFTLAGQEVTSLGSFLDLGANSSVLTWVAGVDAEITPGDYVMFAPGIAYPAGSGFSEPLTTMERFSRWQTGANDEIINSSTGIPLNAAKQDFQSYSDLPNIDYLVLYGRERAALHYILKKIEIIALNGKLVVPSSELGCLAFAQNMDRRIDAPAISDPSFAAGQSYSAWVYYPPRSLNEVWQLEIKYTPYQGLKDANFIEDATIVSEPLFFAHTQGGGDSVFQSDGNIRFTPIAMHLPALSTGIKEYQLNGSIHLRSDTYDGPDTFRILPLLPSLQGYSLPTLGMRLRKQNKSSNPHTRSLSLSVFDRFNNNLLGFRTPTLYNSNTLFQSVVAFTIAKGEEKRLLVATYNGKSNQSIAFDTAKVAIDLFPLSGGNYA